jgi:hypothetical protein
LFFVVSSFSSSFGVFAVFECVCVFVTSRKNDFFFDEDDGEKCNPKSSRRANLLLEFVVVVILFLRNATPANDETNF